MNAAFYVVEKAYILYLKQVELAERGFTTVFNTVYANHEKFVYGAVLEVDSFSYFVPISSYSKQKQDNILIRIKSKQGVKVCGSLRFNYMIPVPKECLTRLVFSAKDIPEDRKILLEKEYRFCKKNRDAIRRQAERTYFRVTNRVDAQLEKNSCDFKLLETACMLYEKQHISGASNKN